MSQPLKIGDKVRSRPGGAQPEIRGVIVEVRRDITGMRALIKTSEDTFRWGSLRNLKKN
jgi:hypothetical protein